MNGPRILFFGRLGDIAGGRELPEAPPPHVRDYAALRDWIGARNPDLAAAIAGAGVRVIRNGAFVQGGLDAFGADDEIAFASPLSGG